MKVKAKANINPQDVLAASLDGIYLVDAGAGTGKTHTLVRRYGNIIRSGVIPRDILMITFTRNAADKLKEEIMGKVADKTNITDFLDAPVFNFHSLCSKLLKSYGTNSPQYLGIKETVTENFGIIENSYYESEVFRRFFLSFRQETKNKYDNIYRSLDDNHNAVLKIIKTLSSRGIFPTASGWFGEGNILLRGNQDVFSEKFDKLNQPKFGRVENQNDLYKLFSDVNSKAFHLDFDFESCTAGKRIVTEFKDELFPDESQEDLINFIRHIYHSYIEFMLKKNFLNFEFVVMLAFLILYNDDSVRKNNQYLYAMVDEFQDTDEIQFLLLMLLLKEQKGKANLAVVGDWKQGIYGFRNTTIENITEFEKRLNEYKAILNSGKKRITFATEDINYITFEYNYRSSQEILNFSKSTLFCPSNKEEKIDKESVEAKFGKILTARRELDDLTEIEFYKAPEENVDSEIAMILKKISQLVNDDKYIYREFGSDGKVQNERRLQYSDICILTRLNNFALKLQRTALDKKIPVTFGGGLELFASEPGILVLAWLRLIMNENDIEGWIPILEKEGYKYLEVLQITRNILSRENTLFSVPASLKSFREYIIKKKDNALFIVESILKRYGFDDVFGNSILNEVSKWTNSELVSIGELVKMMDHARDKSFDIELNKNVNSAVTQSIHMAKGLEYPVVILANMNRAIFPLSRMTYNDIFYHPAHGLRMRRIYGNNGPYSAIFSNWKNEILMKMFKPENYDEERRLLYVAATRAKQYLYFTSCKPSKFFESLAELTGRNIITDFDYDIIPAETRDKEKFETIKLPEKIIPGKKFYSVHGLMEEKNLESNEEESSLHYRPNPEAVEYGVRFHLIAHKLASGLEIDSGIEEVKKLKKFIKDLNADSLRSEVDFLFPKGDRVIRGTIDLIAFYPDRIEVIDYKTDKSKKRLEQYKIQVSIYKELISGIYKDKKVTGKIYFVRLDEVTDV